MILRLNFEMFSESIKIHSDENFSLLEPLAEMLQTHRKANAQHILGEMPGYVYISDLNTEYRDMANLSIGY